ncbi:Translocation protein SEC62 [Scedosporium apiospermum]|uniref:Translocation protein SEC62 n=1 Tax=Pseudallescheria apiosperma TaxID=563466 RepID=A0A084G1Q8_PSEDA|nr:Translocation protein SEC62 [Scedosporium apiospermum]KEZ41270.1 Translocation protein SEC62 [Scedosporium apiospermum]
MSMPMPGPGGPAGAGGPGGPGGPGIPIPMGPFGPGQMPTPEQIQIMQRQLAMEAQKAGMTVPEFVEHLKKQAREQQMRMQQAAQQQQRAGGGPGPQHQHGPQGNARPQGQPQPITPGPPNPRALALAKFLKGQDLKPRTCILNGERKDMFRVKRALRALQSPAYEKARKKNPLLPEITDRASLENTFKLLPMSMLALRVTKIDPHEGHNHGKKPKRVKGLWTVKIEPQQDAHDDMYYAWLWEGAQIKRKVYAVLALILIFLIVLYPLWPVKLRQGVYYLSWGFLGLLGLFFLMAIFRVILFCVTYFVVPPGLWLYPNLWEDVSFMDSFRPVWAWHETEPQKKKKKKTKSHGLSNMEAQSHISGTTGNAPPATDTQINTEPRQRSYVAPKVEELADDE